jgi:predicted GIY-YIG superfamily endonuclease
VQFPPPPFDSLRSLMAGRQRLAYQEVHPDELRAVARERQLKRWTRSKQ